MIAELPFAILIAGAGLLGLYLANLFYDAKIPQYISRKLGHLGGAVAFLLCPLLFSSFWWPFILTVTFTALLGYARWFRPHTFRGVGGSGRPEALAEIHYPATGIVLIGILWGIFNQPWLAIIPLTFMGAGDAITGLIRSRVYGYEVKGNWGSVGMLITCLILAYFIQPYWIGAIGAISAVIVEKWTPTTRYIDDNLSIPLVSGFVMAILTFVFT
jgi:dolichol kinase